MARRHRPPDVRDTVHYVGVVVPHRSANLAAAAAGTVTGELVGPGTAVAKGDLLAVIASPSREAERQAARSALRSAEVEAKVAEVALSHARERAESTRSLTIRGATSSADEARAKLALEEARAASQVARAQVGVHRAEVERLDALIDAARLTAPFDAQIVGWSVAPGEQVAPGDPVVRLAASERLQVRFAVPISDASSLSIGQQVEVAMVPGPGRAAGTIHHIAPTVDVVSQLVFVEAELEPAGPEVVGGAAAVVFQPVRPCPGPGRQGEEIPTL